MCITLGAEKAYDVEGFVGQLRARKVSLHTASNTRLQTGHCLGRNRPDQQAGRLAFDRQPMPKPKIAGN